MAEMIPEMLGMSSSEQGLEVVKRMIFIRMSILSVLFVLFGLIKTFTDF